MVDKIAGIDFLSEVPEMFRAKDTRADEWMKTDEGKRCTKVIVITGPAHVRALKNRLKAAFLAGSNLAV